jgi:hypothetical protein
LIVSPDLAGNSSAHCWGFPFADLFFKPSSLYCMHHVIADSVVQAIPEFIRLKNFMLIDIDWRTPCWRDQSRA